MPVKRTGGLLRRIGLDNIRLLRQRGFGLMFIATLSSFLGVGAGHIAVFWLMLELTDSPAALGLLVATSSVAGVIIPPLSGVLIDRLDRRLYIIALDVLAATALTLTGAAVISGLLQPWMLFACLFLTQCSYSAYRPASGALIQEIIEPGDLSQANSLYVVAVQASYLSGSAFAGFLVAAAGGGWVLGIAALAYLGSAVSYTFLRRGISPPRPDGKSGRFVGDLGAGLNYIRSNPLVLHIVLLTMFPWVAISVFNTLLAPLVRDALGGTAFSFGLVDAMVAVGSVVAGIGSGLIFSRLSERFLIWGATAISALMLGLLAATPCVCVAMAFSLGLGLATTVAKVTFQTALQRHVPRDFMGRVMSASIFVDSLFVICLMLAAGYTGEYLGVRASYALMGLVVSIGAVWGWLLTRRQMVVVRSD